MVQTCLKKTDLRSKLCSYLETTENVGPDTENIVETKANTSCGQLLCFSGDLNGQFAGGDFVIYS